MERFNDRGQEFSPLARYEAIKQWSARKWKVNTYVANEFEFMRKVMSYRKK